MSTLLFVLIGLFILICLILALIILIQKGRGGGLSGAFGGGGGGNTAFGAKTGDMLTWATSVIFGIFLVLAIALSMVADRVAHPSAPSSGQTTPAAPVNPPQP